MMFVIKGYDKRYSSRKKAEVYGQYDNRKDCYWHLNFLKTGCLGDIIVFFVEEVQS